MKCKKHIKNYHVFRFVQATNSIPPMRRKFCTSLHDKKSNRLSSPRCFQKSCFQRPGTAGNRFRVSRSCVRPGRLLLAYVAEREVRYRFIVCEGQRSHRTAKVRKGHRGGRGRRRIGVCRMFARGPPSLPGDKRLYCIAATRSRGA
jgi:hypothetical protein